MDVVKLDELPPQIPLLYPRVNGQPMPALLPKLHRMLIHRIPYHRKMMWRSLIFTPVTFPFALIPVLPNFPMFYVLWRAWSHYKAYRGATYLEQLLKLGFIKPSPSPELDEVYQSRGMAVVPEGAENTAPDGTSSEGVKVGSTTARPAMGGGMESGTGRVESEGARPQSPEAAAGPPQVQGEGPAPDGTATPSSMVYRASSGGPSDNGPAGSTDAESSTLGGGSGSASPTRHPNVLLGLGQVELIKKTFELRPIEVMDLHRAVDQANMRAVKAEEKEMADKAEAEKGEKGDQSPKTNWRGNLHR